MKSEEYQKGVADTLSNMRALQSLAKEVGMKLVWDKGAPAVVAPPKAAPEPTPIIARPAAQAVTTTEMTFPIVWNEEPVILQRYAYWCASMRPGTETNTYYALKALGIDRRPTRGDCTRMTHLLQKEGKFKFVGITQRREMVDGVRGSYRILVRTDK